MKTINSFDTYFAKKGISTRYNSLGYTGQMVSAFVNETKSIVGKNKSNTCKEKCYSLYYNMVDRPKYTGFEWAKEADLEIRERLYKAVSADITAEQFFLDNTKPDGDYKTLLLESLPKEGKNLLYLSGGIDSEMIALTLLESNIAFTPIILEYISEGKVMNDYDTSYAKEFCEVHNVPYHTHKIDVTELWKTESFFDLAVELGSVSPQQATYAYAVEQIASLFPDMIHMFGGEIRYLSDVEAEDNRLADLVMMVKTVPSYNNTTYYFKYQKTSGGSAAALLKYDSIGSWYIQSNGYVSAPTGGPAGGTWTNTPSSTYQFNTTLTLNTLITMSGSSATVYPSGTTGWLPINGLGIQVCYVGMGGNGNIYGNAVFNISIRAVTSPSTVITTTMAFRIDTL